MSAPHHHKLEQQCRIMLQSLFQNIDLTGVSSIAQLCHAVAGWRQRPIHLMGVRMPPGLTGVWIPAETEDIIAYSEHAPTLVRNQAIAHELGHLLLGHRGKSHAIAPSLLALFSYVAPTRIQHLLGDAFGRTGYASDEEYEAEFLGSLIEQALAELCMGVETLAPDEDVIRVHMTQWMRALRAAK